MNQAMPPQRTFTSGPPAMPPPDAAPHGPSVPPSQGRWLVPLLAGLGGAAGGAALVVLALVLLGSMPQASLAMGLGDPLDMTPALALAEGTGAEDPPAETTGIMVDVAGAVARPGLHRLRAGDRVGDAIAAAGGYAPRVDLTAASQSLNLAQPLEDGAKVLVPELGVERPDAAARDDGRIDLNRAGQAELESLPGIGPVTARKIVDARSDRRFGAIRDLRTRGLVSESVFDELQGLVRAG